MPVEKYTTKSFVLASYERGEADILFKVFSREFGLIFVLAKSIRKINSKLKSHIMLGRMSKITITTGREFYRLTGAEELEKKEIDRLICEALDRFIKGRGVYKTMFDK
jgi:Recombinational DNA repair protein (RecF pathway)